MSGIAFEPNAGARASRLTRGASRNAHAIRARFAVLARAVTSAAMGHAAANVHAGASTLGEAHVTGKCACTGLAQSATLRRHVAFVVARTALNRIGRGVDAAAAAERETRVARNRAAPRLARGRSVLHARASEIAFPAVGDRVRDVHAGTAAAVSTGAATRRTHAVGADHAGTTTLATFTAIEWIALLIDAFARAGAQRGRARFFANSRFTADRTSTRSHTASIASSTMGWIGLRVDAASVARLLTRIAIECTRAFVTARVGSGGKGAGCSAASAMSRVAREQHALFAADGLAFGTNEVCWRIRAGRGRPFWHAQVARRVALVSRKAAPLPVATKALATCRELVFARRELYEEGKPSERGSEPKRQNAPLQAPKQPSP